MSTSPYAQGAVDAPMVWECDRYSFVAVYRATTLTYALHGGGAEEPQAFVRYNLMRILNNLTVIDAAEPHGTLLEIKGTNLANDWARFDIIDTTTGTLLGTLRRHFWASIDCDTWTLQGPDLEPLGAIREDFHGLMRHAVRITRSYGLFVHGHRVGGLRAAWRTGWEMDLSTDPGQQLDRRLAVAMAAVIITIESLT